MNNQIIVADAGPLIAFGRLNLLSVLTQIFGSVIIPQAVANECVKDRSRPGANAIEKAVRNQIITIHENPKTEQFTDLCTLLGQGESAAITLAIELNTNLLIDEKLARYTAKQLNLTVIGTAGTLLLAKQKNLITAVLPIIQELKKIGYYLSDSLIHEIAKIANESFGG